LEALVFWGDSECRRGRWGEAGMFLKEICWELEYCSSILLLEKIVAIIKLTIRP